jgi:hypothetical protein
MASVGGEAWGHPAQCNNPHIPFLPTNPHIYLSLHERRAIDIGKAPKPKAGQ